MSTEKITCDDVPGIVARYANRPRKMAVVLGDALCVVADVDEPTERPIATMESDDVGRPLEESEHVIAANLMAFGGDDIDGLAALALEIEHELERHSDGVQTAFEHLSGAHTPDCTAPYLAPECNCDCGKARKVLRLLGVVE